MTERRHQHTFMFFYVYFFSPVDCSSFLPFPGCGAVHNSFVSTSIITLVVHIFCILHSTLALLA